jgi:hypothetical protein
MAAILVITVQGVSPQEIRKNLSIVDNFMRGKEDILTLYSDVRINPRIYYNPNQIRSKDIHDIVSLLRTDKDVNKSIHTIAYSGSLNKA